MNYSRALQEAMGSGELPKTILEASLGRIWQHHGKHGFVILTSWRAENSLEQNKANLQKLKGLVRGAGYGFIQAEGLGQEDTPSGEVVATSEPVLLVPGRGDLADLRKQAVSWGKKFNQYAIVFHDPEDGSELVGQNGERLDHWKKFSANVATKFLTRLKKGGSFALEWIGVKYADPLTGGFMQGLHEQSQGRLLIAECSDRYEPWLAKMEALCRGESIRDAYQGQDPYDGFRADLRD